MPMGSDDDKRPLYARWRNSDVSRNFHRLGLLVAAIILMTGLLLMAKDALGLRFWDLIPEHAFILGPNCSACTTPLRPDGRADRHFVPIGSDIPILAGGIAIGLTGIGLVSLAAYGTVRAIGWTIDKSV